MGRVDLYTLRRRRLMGLVLLSAMLLGGLAMNGWTVSPIWTVFQRDEGAFVAGDPFGDWIYAVCDGEQQQVTVSRNGRLSGAAALDGLRTVRFPDWCDLPTVDNPDLAAWQAQLARLRALTEQPGSSGADILNAAREMPVSYLYLKPLADWIRNDRANAIAFLDAVAARPMQFRHPDRAVAAARERAFVDLVGDALESAMSREVAPGKLETWLAESQIAGSADILQTLARASDLGQGASELMLRRLEKVRGPERRNVYAALAPNLVHDPRFAALLTEQLRHLAPQSRAAKARELLLRSDVSVQFPIGLLSSFRETFGFASPDAQLDVFMAVAGKLRDQPEAPLLLTRQLRDLPDIQRRMAATYLLGLDPPGESDFALAVLRAFADLHPLSRPKVLYAVMQSPQFNQRAVQEASLLAVRLETTGRERQELLGAMLRHGELDEDLYSRIRAELG